ncbi:hypothetical protein MBRA1_003226 [Malassezia brasiliensis]|uniref:VPS9 domain-containing protein n=1 Tax=Malassezia brasiliensis TaxID=1821822 RepID=A0AAF0DZU7_9BASI|nr:hypothetical protein MBRA1_003226 [Malassezia brasiliensis]
MAAEPKLAKGKQRASDTASATPEHASNTSETSPTADVPDRAQDTKTPPSPTKPAQANEAAEPDGGTLNAPTEARDDTHTQPEKEGTTSTGGAAHAHDAADDADGAHATTEPDRTHAESARGDDTSDDADGKRDTAAATPSAKAAGKAPVPQPAVPKPFDFNRFLEQMKHRSAVPVNEYVRSFFRGFTKRPYKPADQVKLIFDFLDFITARMAEASVWARLSDAEFDQATEAMEKLIMNRLYTYTFPPAVEQEGHWRVQTNDLERDEVLSRRIQLLSWIEERHLDMPTGTHSARFVDFAVQELRKVNHYRAPRDKIICILNCCKVIFGLIRHLGKEENADAFVPLLILVILRANPPHLVSNVEYILRFKNPNRPTSEADYYLSSLSGAIAFIESMDHTALSNVTEAEFDAQVQRTSAALEAQAAAEANDAALPLSAQVAAVSLADDARAFLQRTGEAARAGLSGPINVLGKLLYERIDEVLAPSEPVQTPAPRAPRAPTRGAAPNAPLRAPAVALLDEDESRSEPDSSPFETPNRRAPWRASFVPHALSDTRDSPSHHVAAAQRASNAEDEAADDTSVDWDAGTQTLKSIFPHADDAVLLLVLQECGGNVEMAIDRLLEMT